MVATTGAVKVVSGIATVSGTITCSGETTAFISGELRQRASRFVVIHGSFSTEVPCSPGGARWSASVVGENGPFVAGRSRVQATGAACEPDFIVCDLKSSSATVLLRAR